MWHVNYISMQLFKNKVGATFLEDSQYTRCHDSRANPHSPRRAQAGSRGGPVGRGGGGTGSSLNVTPPCPSSRHL